MDYSGTTFSGQQVMGIVRGGAASSHVRVIPELMWPVPSHWSLEDAATVPLAYAQAYYYLGITCKLLPGMTVLVHGGSGALGQAVIAIALYQDCEVFTTVSDTRKKVFLRRLFPDLKVENIGNSRDHTFGDMILNITNGRGCDVIISCVEGDLKNTTLKCASYCGITIDTAQAHNADNYSYGMYSMTKQRSYTVVNFSSIFESKEDMKKLQVMISEGIACGYVRPLSRVTYPSNMAAHAFHLLSTSRHRGRVLLCLRDSMVTPQHRLVSSLELCQLVICDEEGFGLQLANRLVSRGAKKLRLHCSKISKAIHLKIRTWQNLGVHVEVSSEDIRIKDGVLTLMMDAIRTGPIGGIYIIIPGILQEPKRIEFSALVSDLDLLSRESCLSLRYFAVICSDDLVGKETCLARARDHLPATVLLLPTLRHGANMNCVEGSISWRSALDAIEIALCSSDPILLAKPQVKKQVPPLHQLGLIADIKVPDDAKTSDTLQTLGLDNCKTQEISNYFKNTHNVSFEKEEIPSFTVQRIKEIEDRSLVQSDFSDVRGLKTFFSQIAPDELLSATEIVFMPTLIKELLRADEFDTSQTYMYIVPGLEGHYARFSSLCYRLKMPALVLQPGLDHLQETPRETAQRFAEILMKKMELKRNFYLLGYESGVLPALELASILEEKGLTGTVFCVGGWPEEIQTTIEEQLHDFETEEALQDAVILHFSTLLSGDHFEELNDKLQNAFSWQEKLDACIRTLRGRMQHTLQYSRLLIEAAYARIASIRDYKLSPHALRSRLVVLRTGSMRSDASLAQSSKCYSKQPIQSYDLLTPLAEVSSDPRCANLINRHLGVDILEAYESQNFCQSYVINGGNYMVCNTA